MSIFPLEVKNNSLLGYSNRIRKRVFPYNMLLSSFQPKAKNTSSQSNQFYYKLKRNKMNINNFFNLFNSANHDVMPFQNSKDEIYKSYESNLKKIQIRKNDYRLNNFRYEQRINQENLTSLSFQQGKVKFKPTSNVSSNLILNNNRANTSQNKVRKKIEKSEKNIIHYSEFKTLNFLNIKQNSLKSPNFVRQNFFVQGNSVHACDFHHQNVSRNNDLKKMPQTNVPSPKQMDLNNICLKNLDKNPQSNIRPETFPEFEVIITLKKKMMFK